MAARKGGKPKKRSGTACLVAARSHRSAVVGGGGYAGYQFWQSHFGPAPDYSGSGSGQVQVEVPKGAGGRSTSGNILKKAGVVKSTDAFVDAAGKSPKGGRHPARSYTLRKQMSAAEGGQDDDRPRQHERH